MKKFILLFFAFCLLANLSFAVDRNVGAGQTYATIQEAIDASTSGDVINVYPGTYNQDEANGWDPITGGSGSSDFNIFVNKSVTIQGVTAGSVPITNYSGVLAFVIPKRDTPLGNLSTFFIQANFKPEAKEKAIELIKAEITKLLDAPVAENELTKARKKLKAQFATEAETVSQIGESIGYYMTVCNDLSYGADYLGVLNSLTVNDLHSIARKYLDHAKSNISVLMPESATAN
jgi:hypothetical protein